MRIDPGVYFMAFRVLSSILFFATMGPVFHANGSILSQAISCTALIMEIPIKAITAPVPENSSVEFQRHDGTKIRMNVGRRLGQGWVGSVIEVNSVSGQQTDLSLISTAIVAKLPNRVLGFSSPIPKAKYEIRSEWALYQKLNQTFPTIQEHERYPQFSSWSSGHPPVVPILGIEETTAGPLLFKPKVPAGSFLKDIAKIFKANNWRLPMEMEESLFQIYEFLQISGQALKIWPDARPANLVWISDPEMMKIMGFKRASFAMIEFSSGPLPTYSEPLNSYWGFRSEFVNLLRLELLNMK